MADNTTITPGTGATIAADDVGGILYQRVKIGVGVDGVATDLAPGQTTKSASLPVTIASDDTVVLQTGALTETAPASDTASSGLNGRLQRIAQRLTSLIGQFPTSLGAQTGANSLSVVPNTDTAFPASQSGAWNITNITGTVSLPTGAATAAKQPALGTAGSASTDVITVQGIASATPLIVGGNVASAATDSGNPVKVGGVYNSTLPTYTNTQRTDLQVTARGALYTQLINSGANVVAVFGATNNDAVATTSTSSILSTTNYGFVYNGSTWDRQRGDTAGAVTQPHALTGSRWNYAAASGGISNTTTAVTFIAAAGASVRNYVTSVQIAADALTNATEVAIRDGAAGTVLWRTKIQTGGLSLTTIEFPVPLKGTANTLMEVVTLTASGAGAVYFSAQGYQAA